MNDPKSPYDRCGPGTQRMLDCAIFCLLANDLIEQENPSEKTVRFRELIKNEATHRSEYPDTFSPFTAEEHVAFLRDFLAMDMRLGRSFVTFGDDPREQRRLVEQVQRLRAHPPRIPLAAEYLEDYAELLTNLPDPPERGRGGR